MGSHLFLRKLRSAQKPDRDVVFLPAITAEGKAIVFIHGYGGNPLKTWSDFPDLLRGEPRAKGTDVFFYGYDGIRAELVASANLFRDFLNRLFLNGEGMVNPSLAPRWARPPEFQFAQVLIVCHSLGAVIARQALLDATTEAAPWLSRVQLALFAPAHKGAKLVTLAYEASGLVPFIGYAYWTARYFSPLIDQLRPGSPTLAALESEVNANTTAGANRHLRPLKTLVAEYERIVSNDRFAGDRASVTVPSRDHMNVCKPSLEFTDPLDQIRGLL